ncbi:MAG TPA: competence/damage-inducible protein A [Chitinophagales bacterium]|nr:competence/damage-inducible protein A [Chitinophagales bacterium]
MQCTIITIGDEILIGQTIDTNSAWMAQQLNFIGIKVFEILSVSDDSAHITNALNRAMQTSQIILTTGGLGPTKDDITKNTLARYFNAELVFVDTVWQDIAAFLTKRGLTALDSFKTMAYLPANCEVIKNQQGTAAAMWFNEQGKILVSMPGVPHEMKDFMSRIVLPRLQNELQLPAIVHKTIMCVGIGESFIAEKIKSVEDSLPSHIKLAYLPNYGVVKLRLSGTGAHTKQITEEVNHWTAEIDHILRPKYAYGYDEEDLTEAIGKLLMERNAMLVTAESCTGGLIAHQITAIAGSSRYYKGGVVVYSNELKQALLGVSPNTLLQHGAVSEETVRQMAQGALARMEAQYAVAVSGIAGPGGGSPDKPVGTVWIAVASATEVRTKKLQLARNRSINIELSANLALAELRKLILGVDGK